MSKRRVWSGVEVEEVEEVEVGGSRREDERSDGRLIAIALEASVLYLMYGSRRNPPSRRVAGSLLSIATMTTLASSNKGHGSIASTGPPN